MKGTVLVEFHLGPFYRIEAKYYRQDFFNGLETVIIGRSRTRTLNNQTKRTNSSSSGEKAQ
jgi:hypothetical protein